MGGHPPTVWIGFSLLVAGLLVVDLGILNRRSHALSLREAGAWSAGLVVLALLFGGFLWVMEGGRIGLEYYTGYVIELSLSVDNLFVFILIFQYFHVPTTLQPLVLKWGILGALVMRAVMITAGALLFARFHWIIWIFGGILVVSGFRMFRAGDTHIAPERNPLVRLLRRYLPIVASYGRRHSFLVRRRGRWIGTPLLLVLVVVEWSDLVFAIDSIPAVFAVTRDPFVVYASNVFAILGLRALYFVLAGALETFRYVRPSVAVILVFVGVKMVASAWVDLPTPLALGVILATLATGVVASLVSHPRCAAS